MNKQDVVRRTPSGYRNLLEVRVGRLRASKPAEVRLQALYELRDIAQAAIDQMESEGTKLPNE